MLTQTLAATPQEHDPLLLAVKPTVGWLIDHVRSETISPAVRADSCRGKWRSLEQAQGADQNMVHLVAPLPSREEAKAIRTRVMKNSLCADRVRAKQNLPLAAWRRVRLVPAEDIPVTFAAEPSVRRTVDHAKTRQSASTLLAACVLVEFWRSKPQEKILQRFHPHTPVRSTVLRTTRLSALRSSVRAISHIRLRFLLARRRTPAKVPPVHVPFPLRTEPTPSLVGPHAVPKRHLAAVRTDRCPNRLQVAPPQREAPNKNAHKSMLRAPQDLAALRTPPAASLMCSSKHKGENCRSVNNHQDRGSSDA